MARYVKDYTIKGQPDELLQKIEDYVVSEGYCITEYDGKTVYKKSSGAINAPSYIRIKYENDILRLQVWIKFPILPNVFVGEYDLQGIVGQEIKGPLSQRVKQIENYIQEYIEQTEKAAQAQVEEAGEVEEEFIFCTNCGAKNKKMFAFCTMCGQKISLPESSVIKEEYMSKKDFIKKKVPHSLLAELRTASIVLYTSIGISIILAIFLTPLALRDLGILLGLTLGMHIGKNKACSIVLLCISLFEMILSIAVTKTLGGFLIVAASIWSLSIFIRIDKLYKESTKRL